MDSAISDRVAAHILHTGANGKGPPVAQPRTSLLVQQASGLSLRSSASAGGRRGGRVVHSIAIQAGGPSSGCVSSRTGRAVFSRGRHETRGKGVGPLFRK